MKHQVFSRALSLTAAAALSCTAVLGNVGLQSTAAQIIWETAQNVRETEQAVRSNIPLNRKQKDDGSPVNVIVKVTGDAVMEQPDACCAGADFLDTEQAAQVAQQCENVQRNVENRIRQLYPQLEIRFSYSTLFNGFSCELPKELIAEVRAIPDVVSVTETQEISVPQMDRAAALSGFPAYFDMTGCSGAGQVVAVIDTELDASHPMFAPLAGDIETAVSREDVTEIINSGKLNISVDPDHAYISNKLPYVIDYFPGDDPYDGVSDPDSYHGTHVSGIAAGNTYVTEDNTTISGIAKDAQLMFFACGKGSGISLDAAMAAFEDAIALHADVINMSWGTIGEYFGENPMSDIIAAADNAGIVVCSSAGNYDNGAHSFGRIITPKSPDTQMISDKAELSSPVLLVASADNTGQSEAGMFVFGGETIVYRPTMDSWGEIHYLTDELTPGDYEYVDCGFGTMPDFEEQEAEGKIALVQRGKERFDLIASNAEQAGAAGIILADKEYPDGMEYVSYEGNINFAVVTYHEGEMLREAENKVVTFTGEKVMKDYPTQVSTYTSWGVKESLDLRPDIMGIGGRVRSAGYEGDEVMSGTSMSSPYLTGCAAVIREYLKQQGTELTGAAFSAYVRRLLMNTAVPYEENGVFVSPRRQGAGLVSLDRAVSAKVLMTGESGDAKLNLFDKLGTGFSFNVNLTNSSAENVTFSEAALRLSTDGIHQDGYYDRDILYGQQALNCTTDFSGPVTVAAGESRAVTVHVDLDAAQYASLKEKFTDGFFIEGYVLLSGAENSADISIPLLGFSDDWTQLAIGEEGTLSVNVLFGDKYYCGGMPLVETMLLLKNIWNRFSPKDKMDFFLHPEKYITEEEDMLMTYGRDEAWISPNGDGIADNTQGISMNLNRWAKANFKMLDADGNVISECASDNIYNPFYQASPIGFDQFFDQSELPEGDYTLVVNPWIDYPGSAEAPQEYRATVHIDKTAPTVSYSMKEQDGRAILTISASDDRQLQGIIVNGIGNGGFAGVYDPEQENTSEQHSLLRDALYRRYYTGADDVLSDYYNHSLPDMAYTTLPYPLCVLSGKDSGVLDAEFDFEDVIAPYTNEFGVLQVEYDVTDLTHYSFTILDNAYNFVEIRSVDDSAEKLVKSKGLWIDMNEGMYEIDGDVIKHVSAIDASETIYSYTAEKDTLVLTSGSKTRTLEVRYINSQQYILIDQDTNKPFILKQDLEHRHTSEIQFHTVNELIEKAIADSAEYWQNPNPDYPENVGAYGEVPVLYNYFLVFPYSISINLTFGPNNYDKERREQYNVTMQNGRGTATYTEGTPDGLFVPIREVNLFEKALFTIPAGLYYSAGLFELFLFNDDGHTGTIMYHDGFGGSYSGNRIEVFQRGDIPFTYTIAEDNSVAFEINGKTLRGSLYAGSCENDIFVRLENDQEEFPRITNFENSNDFKLITADPARIALLRSTEKIAALALAYEKAVTGLELELDAVFGTMNGIVVSVFDESGFSEAITFDFFTLKGWDSYGHEIDIVKIPKLPEGSLSLPEYTEMTKAYLKETENADAELIELKIISGSQIYARLYWNNYDDLETYTFDPITGFCVDEAGNLIRLFPNDTYRRGDVTCDGAVDVADAVLLARYLAEDTGVTVTETGRKNGDCNCSGAPDQNDIVLILRSIARLIKM